MPWVIFDEPEDVGSVDAEFLIWREQAPALHEGFLAAIGALARSGNLVAVAAGGRTQAEFERHLAGTPTMWVGLYCDPDVLIAREQSRNRPVGRTGRSVSLCARWLGLRPDLRHDRLARPICPGQSDPQRHGKRPGLIT